KAAEIYRRAVELGDVDAMNNLGDMYETGSGVKLDKKKAERLYRAAADRGHAVSQCNLANLLHSEKKCEEAVRYLVLSADQGFTASEACLGVCYRDGEGTEKAAKIYRRAVELGVVHAMSLLGEMYNEGWGVKLDKKKATRLFRMAADRGDACAQVCSAEDFYSEKKFEEAFRYFALAANQGYTHGECHLGGCYLTGAGTEGKFEEAFRCYALSADQGYTIGEHNLGCCYYFEKGTELDLGKARYWFERAAAKGDDKATECLALLDARV
ncbi:hypothetical protein AURANDRAFT_19925, partial [Aureococcus anophagefferens]